MSPSFIIQLPPLVNYAVACVSSAASLLLTQSLISNRTEKLVTGMASIFIPLGWLLLVAVLHSAHARITSARITAGMPTDPDPSRLVTTVK